MFPCTTRRPGRATCWPGWVLGALFGLAVLMLLLALVADTVFRQENFY